MVMKKSKPGKSRTKNTVQIAISKKAFEFLEHTSEAKFRAYGTTLDEAFANAARALFSIMTKPEKVKPKITKTVMARTASDDLKGLLYDFLGELIILKDADQFFLHDISVAITDGTLLATCTGDTLEGYELGSDVKAVTYNDMLVEKAKDGWVVQVVVDV